MRKTATKLAKVKVNGQRYWCVSWPRSEKGRNRRFFKATARRAKDDKGRKAAQTFLETKEIEQRNYGTAGMSFNERQRAEYIECEEKLRPYGKALRDAVAFYLPHLEASNRTCTAAELKTELLRVKKADGASDRYLGDLRSRLGQFARHFNGLSVAEITSMAVDEWLRSLSDPATSRQLAPTTRNNFRRVLIVAFNYARKRGYCADNPAERSAKAKNIESAVGILTVEQTARLLERSPASLLPYVAIGAFAGLRRAELERLDWREVDLKGGLIEVTAKKAKSARRRFVRIRPNLARWLKPHAKANGTVTPADYRELLDAAREAAEIKAWPNNALRHGFASYHLANFKDSAALALEMGHTSSNVVFQHYRQVVNPKQAAKYWALAPAAPGKKFIDFKVAA